jgi:general secretion pathway protein D
VVASKPDYETLRRLVAKLDIAKDQVYIKTVIMEMGSSNSAGWGVNYYKFAGDTNGIGRIGFRGSSDITSLTSPAGDQGAILGFGGGGLVTVKINGADVQVPSLAGLINLLKSTTNSNIISTPEIMALNNEESLIEVGKEVPVSLNATPGTNGIVVPNIERKKVTTKLTITPYISPDTDSVKLKINQEVSDLIPTQTKDATELTKNAMSTSTRQIKTNIVVDSGDTAVLGGLIEDKDTETVTKVPVLGDIPILGWLFKSQNHSKEKMNLTVFITPKVIRSPDDNASVMETKLSQRIDFIQQSMNGRDPNGKYIDELPRRKKAAAAPTEPDGESPEEPAIESF